MRTPVSPVPRSRHDERDGHVRREDEREPSWEQREVDVGPKTYHHSARQADYDQRKGDGREVPPRCDAPADDLSRPRPDRPAVEPRGHRAGEATAFVRSLW
ncbi:hypothetical protein [Natrinema gelatinilyticum]|uniref:hypothetical protein n=1 Tax=Natrinema gelatinilyticum TaxID=2961571 RepID=UPI0020C1BD01|nr:hypothetical protein [Natrinema gelatinilyticum]